MGMNSTNRIIDPEAQFRKELRRRVNEKLKKLYNKESLTRNRRDFHKLLKATVACTKCKRQMSKDFADKQLFYGKKDAPICIPCIMGLPRRDLSKTQLLKPQVQKSLDKIKNKKKNEKNI